jgi:hypothetical protein
VIVGRAMKKMNGDEWTGCWWPATSIPLYHVLRKELLMIWFENSGCIFCDE